MKLKKGILAGMCALLVTGLASVSYGATQKEICEKMWDSFQGLRKYSGLMVLNDEQRKNSKKYAKALISGATDSLNAIKVDKNYEVLNKEVIYHAKKIDKAADANDLEEIQVQFRRLTIGCRNCHKIYETQKRLVP